jgi:hypothetical protein
MRSSGTAISNRSAARDANIGRLDPGGLGWVLTAVVPSCVDVQAGLPLLFPEDERVQRVAKLFDPFEYLMLRHRDGSWSLRREPRHRELSGAVPFACKTSVSR